MIFRGVIMGAPGSGKGTISAMIVREFNLRYLSVGDQLRDQMSRQTVLGKELSQYISCGKLVPDHVVNRLVMTELRTNLSHCPLLVDGYPRTLSQANELTTYVDLNSVINLIVPDDEIIERIKHRWIHLKSGRIYHSIYNPPKVWGLDDMTGEELVQRSDDREDVIIDRLLTYKRESEVIINYFREKGILQNFTGRQTKEIYPKVKLYLTQLMNEAID